MIKDSGGRILISDPCTDCGKIVMRRRNQLGTRCAHCSRQLVIKPFTSLSGEKNKNWKGGITPDIFKFYHSPEWKLIRTTAFRRDNYTCCDCGTQGGKLEANHKMPRSRFPKLALMLSNIETLCKPCHNKKKWIVYAPNEFFCRDLVAQMDRADAS